MRAEWAYGGGAVGRGQRPGVGGGRTSVRFERDEEGTRRVLEDAEHHWQHLAHVAHGLGRLLVAEEVRNHVEVRQHELRLGGAEEAERVKRLAHRLGLACRVAALLEL